MVLRVDIYTQLIALGIFQGLLIAFFLLRYKSESQNRLLAFAVIALIIVAGGSLAFYSKYILLNPHLLRVHSPFVFLIPPLVYLYVSQNLEQKQFSFNKQWYHFLPFVIAVLSFMPVYLLSKSTKLIYIREQFIGLQDSQYVFYFSAIISFIVYFVLIITKLYNSYKQESQSTSKRQLFKWLLIYSTMLLLIVSAAIVRIFIGISGDSSQWIPLLITLFMYYISFVAIRNPQLFQVNKTKKYQQSKAGRDELETMIEAVSTIIKSNELYRDAHISIQDLAKQAKLNVNDLSRAINELLGMNYFDFINSFRVEQAKAMLLDPAYEHYSIEGIGDEAGFKSKAAYYSAFKKSVKKTPLAFKQEAVQLSKNKP